VVGIGLNINQMNFSENLSSATSLSIETNTKYELDIILNQLINFLNIRYNELIEGYWDKIDNSYLNVVYKFGEYAYYQANGKIFEAKIVHIEKDGRIALLTKKNELLYFAFKEVHFINSTTG
jgi:BirA family biotin operon repressor/biotin-[acetyl-CoA-carboxylase] ligase